MNAPFPAPLADADRREPHAHPRPASPCLTVSDTRDEESDTSGHILVERLTGAGHALAGKAVVPDDKGRIRAQVMAWVASGEVDVILTTGGTGLTGRDVTPDAIEPLFYKRIDRDFRSSSTWSATRPSASPPCSRAPPRGVIGDVFVFCLPGSNGAVKDGWDKVISAQLDSRHRPCNFVEIMPRLAER